MAKQKSEPILIPPPPTHLSTRATELWQAVVPSRAQSPERVAVVQTALEALDRADAAAVIEREGMLVAGGKTPHAHPLLKVEKDNRQLFAKLWRQLGLSGDNHTF